MEYTITRTKWQHGDISDEHVERFEGTAQEIAELLRLTNGMSEVVNLHNVNFPCLHTNSKDMEEIISKLSETMKKSELF